MKDVKKYKQPRTQSRGCFLSDHNFLKEFCEDMSVVFAQKCQLGLVDGLQEKQFEVKISCENQGFRFQLRSMQHNGAGVPYHRRNRSLR